MNQAGESMKLLKLIGYWTEPGSVLPYPHPKDFVDPNWHPDLREKLVRYLRDGAIYTRSWGHSPCRFEDGPPDKEMGSKDLTDGCFMWPEGLHIYVSRYHVVLPEEFVENARRNDFKVPEGLKLIPSEFAHLMKTAEVAASGLVAADVDHDYWVHWAENYKHGISN